MKKIIPYLSLFLCIIFSTLIWDFVRIPYNEQNIIYGEFFTKKYNPINEILRFIIFVFFPLIVFLFLSINKNNFLSLNYKKNNFFLSKRKTSSFDKSNLSKFSIVFFVLIIVEFFSLDFSYFTNKIDSLHDGVFLVPPKNYFFSDKLWLTTMYDYGVISNNIGIIISKFFNDYTIGSIRFFNLFLILINKIILLFICKKIVETLNFSSIVKNIFFVLLFFMSTSLVHYENSGISPFPPRIFLFLIFLLILIDIFSTQKNLRLKSFILGTFSLISLLWYVDIGIYTNATILVIISYFVFDKKLDILNFFILGIISSWTIFFSIFSLAEIKEFFFQIKFLISTKDFIIGIEYPKPFSEGSVRYTKTLLLLILSGVFSINLLFNKKINLNYETKLIILLLFISSIFFFKTALGRSDTPHLKYSSGLYIFLIYFSFIFFVINFFKGAKFLKKRINLEFNKNYVYVIVGLLFVLTFIVPNKNKSFKNFTNFPNNIENFIQKKDSNYLSKKNLNFINEFKKLSKNDNCVQVFTGDVSIPYLLKKPSCTQFYLPSHIIAGWTEKKFINQLKDNSPEFIVYSSSNNWLIDKRNMKDADKFIKKKYNLFKKIEEWEIYKKAD